MIVDMLIALKILYKNFDAASRDAGFVCVCACLCCVLPPRFDPTYGLIP